MSLKTFIAEGEASADHALRFLTYKKDQHGIVSERIRDAVLSGWVAVSASIPAAPAAPQDTKAPIHQWLPKKKTARKSNAVTVDAKSTVAKHGRRFRVGPVVKIGGAYHKDDRDDIKTKLFTTARLVLEKLATKLNDGGDGPFWVSQRHHNTFDDIVFEFRTGHIAEPIFVVGSDRAVSGDVVYFRDYVTRE